ncbi:G-type lectin S-receptor-like serine/threonine-protein kinase B120 isoform X2 [Elaeis guineensis]|uniref:Receptor-like serine/threonine-protein kinase n=1 Tax=Elaeis guineensis var. tenera TaxID=51953 RepID=A0A8N4EZR7_ELAGV|nr:G-type lectin S-receptor-like serine/threonine-protein kinase B120 isoform X2 [Elaeis guineensis]
MEWPLLCLAIFLLLSSSHPLVASDDRLSPGESMSLNETLVSDGGAFALGFFPLGNSPPNLYLAIWYNNIAQKTIVWVANREKPINVSSAILTISNDSNLLLVDSKGSVFWSSNVKNNGSSKNSNPAAVLLNDGNLVLRDGSDTILWQSFDHLTDTFLPGMKFKISYKTHEASRLTSWKDPQDPSLGNFSYGGDPNTYFEAFTWQGSQPYWRRRVWDGRLYSARQVTNSSYMTYQTVIATADDEFYVTYSLSDGSSNIRIKLDHSGQLQLLGWDSSLNNWRIATAEPSSTCDKYGHCGTFGYCDRTESVPACKCMEGFEPKFQSDWNRRNFSGGCVRRTPLKCGSRDVFSILGSMKLPDQFLYLRNKTIGECKAECIANCLCNAYAYANLSMGTRNVSRCLVWTGELIDAEMFGSEGENLYLRLVGSELGSKRNKRIIIIVAVLLSGAILLTILTYLAWNFRDKIRGIWKDGKDKGWPLDDLSLSTDFPKDLSISSGYGKPGHGPRLPLINFESIAVATNNFSDSHKLGQGGFGKVYKGKLPRGQEIAIKRLSRNSGQGLEEFKNEVSLIAKLQHRNLVRLLGCCIQGEERLLIYEYMPNKSLDAFLFDPAKKHLLDWQRRFSIIKGIARGLLYLHQDSRLRIIHRDLKAANILLDQDMNPKISDFGMARIFGGDQNEVNTNRIVGTYGYMSPEYGMGGLFSVKSDVYSFGVLILEIVSSSRNSSFHLTMDSPGMGTMEGRQGKGCYRHIFTRVVFA